MEKFDFPTKPKSCIGCPQYDNPLWYSRMHDEGYKDLCIISDSPTKDQIKELDPYAGQSGKMLTDMLIPLSGTKSYKHDFLVRCWVESGYERKKGGKERVKEMVRYCSALKEDRSSKLVVCHGDWAARFVGGVKSALLWRGFLAGFYNGIKIAVTVATQTLGSNRRLMVPVMNDWRRIGQYLREELPLPIPKEQAVTDGQSAYKVFKVLDWYAYAVVDTEYETYEGTVYPGELTLIGILLAGINGQRIIQVEWQKMTAQERSVWGQTLQTIVERMPVVFHNAMADIPVLEKYCGVSFKTYKRIEDTMLMHALLYSESEHTLGFLESMYSPYPKLKHLKDANELVYNKGDVLTTNAAYVCLRDELGKDTQSTEIYEKQSLALLEPRLVARKRGIKLDQDELHRLQQHYQGLMGYASEVADDWVPGGINLGSNKQVSERLIHEGFKLKKGKTTQSLTVGGDAIAALRQDDYPYDPEEEKDGITIDQCDAFHVGGANMLLISRAMYQKAHQLSTHFIKPLLQKDRCYPEQFIHTQTSGRWSTIKPAIATYPPKLRHIFIPDEGRALVKFDWSQIELRINAAVVNDEPTLEAFNYGYDIHTLNCCDIFGLSYPQNKVDPHGGVEDEVWRRKNRWEGKDDKRRVFAKTFVYRLLYRGNPKYAGDILGAAKMNLDKDQLKEAAENWLVKHPAYREHWQRIDQQLPQTRIVRSVYGRRRYLNGKSSKMYQGHVPDICREGSNHIFQATVSDIFNETVVAVWNRFKDEGIYWGWGSHDSQVWDVPADKVEYMMVAIEVIASQPREINGVEVNFPIDWEEVKYGNMEQIAEDGVSEVVSK